MGGSLLRLQPRHDERQYEGADEDQRNQQQAHICLSTPTGAAYPLGALRSHRRPATLEVGPVPQCEDGRHASLRRWGAVQVLLILFLGPWLGQLVTMLAGFRSEHDPRMVRSSPLPEPPGSSPAGSACARVLPVRVWPSTRVTIHPAGSCPPARSEGHQDEPHPADPCRSLHPPSLAPRHSPQLRGRRGRRHLYRRRVVHAGARNRDRPIPRLPHAHAHGRARLPRRTRGPDVRTGRSNHPTHGLHPPVRVTGVATLDSNRHQTAGGFSGLGVRVPEDVPTACTSPGRP